MRVPLEAVVAVCLALLIRHMAKDRGEVVRPEELKPPRIVTPATFLGSPGILVQASEWRGQDKHRTEGQRSGLKKLRSG
jgi:hypothetical protein